MTTGTTPDHSPTRSRVCLLSKLHAATWAAFMLLSSAWARAAEAPAAAVVVANPSSDAGDDSPTPARTDAEAHYARGVEAYREQHYELAIEQFLRADVLAPRAALSFNVARAYEKLHEPSRALQYYRDYLRRGADASNRDEVTRRVRELQAALAERGVQQVTVRSKPSGAAVFIDGKRRGETPWTSELPLGTHQLQARRDGHRPVDVALTLDASRAQDLELELPAIDAADTLRTGGHGSVGPRMNTAAASEGHVRERGSLQPWPWLALTAGGATLAAAGVFELLRRDAEADATRAHYQTDYYDDRERMNSRQTTARVLLGVSAVFLVTGGVLAFVDGAPPRPEYPPVALGCDPTTCLGTWRGNF